jgi:biotin-dependent carboxylase-like uncharacterized protein
VRAVEVLATGPSATVQDLGRPGLAHLGVGPSGAADRGSLRQVNRLLGNPEHAAGIEILLGGFAVRALADLDVGLVGATCPAAVVRDDGGRREVGGGAPQRLRRGDVLELGQATRGLRCYLGVRGGVVVPAVLGSRSTDLLAGVGPAPLVAGDVLPVGSDVGEWPGVDEALWHSDPVPARPLTAVAGPRADWFEPGTTTRLADAQWRVSTQADRSAVVLDGPGLRRSRSDEVPVEGMARGAVQVPPSGRPTVLMSDHPVTGGYPVVAVLLTADVDRLAQLRPGDPVALRLLAPARL